MAPGEFRIRWRKFIESTRQAHPDLPEFTDDMRLVTASVSILDCLSLPPQTLRFLTEEGLPKSCAPFLNFEAIERGPRSLPEYYGESQFEGPDQELLANFYVIGNDSAGNPICIDKARNGEVWHLDHEDGFRTQIFVASNIQNLAEALLLVPSDDYEGFMNKLRKIDPAAAFPNSFLTNEVAMLKDTGEI